MDDKTEVRELTNYVEVTSVAALALSLCGLTNQYALLAQFGISLSDYADLDDFLVASINLSSSVGSLGFVGIATITLFGFILFGIIIFRHKLVHHLERDADISSKGKRIFYKFFRNSLLDFYLLVIVCGIVLAYFLGHIQADDIKKGLGCKVDIQIAHPHTGFKPSSDQSDTSELFAITGLNSAFFVMEKSSQSVSDNKDAKERTELNRNYIAVHSIPYSNISQITTICNE